MKLNGRLIIFCLLTVIQAVVVLMLCSFGNHYTKTKLGDLITRQVDADNVVFTQQLESTIETLQLYDLRIGADDWKVLQEIVEQTRLPNDGFLCVLDLDTHRLLCHPEFKDSPEISESEMPYWKTLSHSGSMVAFKGSRVVRTGKVDVFDESYCVAGRNLGDFNVGLLALQKEDRIDERVSHSAFLISKLIAVICTIGLFLTTLFGVFVIWWTERKIADANEEVEQLAANRNVQSKAFVDFDAELAGTGG